MNLDSEIGTAKDNTKSPIHNWYKFTAGFSYKLIDYLIRTNNVYNTSTVYEPFAGCGTTLVQAQKKQIRAVGNEGQKFMFDVIRAKLNWGLSHDLIKEYLSMILEHVILNKNIDNNFTGNQLLDSLYSPENLKELYLIRDYIKSIDNETIFLFFSLALSQTLHKCSIYPISVPYISRSKKLKNTSGVLNKFEEVISQMLIDIASLNELESTSNIFLHDSRKANKYIPDNSCDVCITSPPYLNNLDYGEVSKVHTIFFGITANWGEITDKVRKNLVTAATTHYSDKSFSIDDWKKTDFYLENKRIAEELINFSNQINGSRKFRGGNKSFDIMLLLYFQDMYLVMKEMRRVLSPNSNTFMVLGDSAPYGIFVPTTDILGRIATNIGFNSTEKYKIRTRGTKWLSLTHRHKLLLDENVLHLS